MAAHKHNKKGVMRRSASIAIAGVLTLGMLAPLSGVANAADAYTPAKANSTLGFPTFKGVADPIPTVDNLKISETSPATSYLKKIFDQDVKNGAGKDTAHDFWIDRMLTRTGTTPTKVDGADAVQGPYGPEYNVSQGTDDNGNKYSYNGYDSNAYLFTRGRAAFMYTYNPSVIGFGGNLAYWDVTGKAGYTITATVGDQKVTLTEDTAQRKQTPSYWTSVYQNADKSLTVTVIKYITNNNVLVTDLQVSGTKDQDVVLTAAAPLAPNADANGQELTGRFAAKNNLTTVYPRFSGDGFAPKDGALTRTVQVKANADPVRMKVQLGLITNEIPESRTEYDAIRNGDRAKPADSYTKHVTEYNQWWVDNIPYIETPEHNIDKTLFYRWWLSRFNYLDANMPSGPMAFPTSIEGVLGYNNAIDLTVGMFIDDLKWMRSPELSYGPWLNMGENARDNGQYRDNQADPENWGGSHTQWISEAAWKSYQIHGGDADIAQKFADYAAGDTKGQLASLDSDGDGLLDTNWNAWTGNDADAVSFDEVSGARLDRAESATVYAGAKAAAEAYREVGGADNEAKAKEMDEYAAKVKKGVLDNLWDSKDKLIRHQFANGAKAGQQAKYKEINNYTPYFTDLMPAEGDSDYNDSYEDALRLLSDADQHPVFPFATANQADDKLVRELGKKPTNNFSVINSTLYFRIYSEAIRKYHAADKGYVTPENFKQLLYWNAYAHYQGGDNQLTDQNEFWNNASTEDGGKVQYRSWIHHTQLGTTNWAVIEDVAGVRTRTDNKLELYPIAIPGWDHFIVNNLSYHGQNLTVVWNGDGHYANAPKGYSAYVGDKLAFTSDKLAHIVYDPATGKADVQDNSGAKVTDATTTTLPDAKNVTYKSTDRVTQVLAKAGVNAVNEKDGEAAANVAKGAAADATFQANDNNRGAKNATDGTTVNSAFWSTKGTPNKTDTLTVDLGKEQTVNDVRLYFYRTSTSATLAGYAEPQMYTVEYLDPATNEWKAVEDQARTPAAPQGGVNRVQFKAVKTAKLRVTVTPQPGQAVGLREFEAYNTSEEAKATGNVAPSVDAYEAGRSVGKVELGGVVKDDGLPKSTITTEWSVVSAPKDGEAKFTDAKSANTSVKFTKAGQYVLRLSASDGDKTGTADVVVTADEYTGEFNIAPQASKVTASYTNTYLPSGNVKVINDGKVSYDGAAPNSSWNNYGDKFDAATTVDGSAYVQYEWPAAVPMTKAQMFLWADGGGVPATKSWKLQYQDADGNWQDVKLKDGSSYGVAQKQGNVVEFAEPVVTKAIRAVFAQKAVVGVSEFEVYAKDPLGIDTPEVATATGKQPTMPKTVSAYYADGSRIDLPVTWDKIEDSQIASDTVLDVAGTAFGTSLDANAKVYVRSNPGTTLNSTVDAEQTVYVGAKSITLPATVPGVYNSGDNHNIPVVWNDADVKAIDLNKPGDYVVNGTATDDLGSKGTQPAKLTVHVEDPNAEPEPEPEPATIESIAVTKKPAKTEYQVGEAFDAKGLEVTATLSDKSTKVLDASEYTVAGFDSSKAGAVTVTVTLNADAKIAAAFEVTVKDKGGEPEPEPEPGVKFVDVTKDTPHSSDIDWLAENKISTGWENEDGTRSFGPMRTVVRQDMAAFLYRLAGSPAFDETKIVNPFTDVNESTPHYKEILWLYSTGIARGYEDGTFGGMRDVNRQDMAAFLHRLAQYKGADAKTGDSIPFPDVDAKTPHAEDIAWLSGTGVTTGFEDGTFGGMRTVVRQDMAAFMHRMDANVLK